MGKFARISWVAILLGSVSSLVSPVRADDTNFLPPLVQKIVPPLVDDFFSDLWTRDTFTSDWLGYRRTLEDRGLVLGSDAIVDVLDNVGGGNKPGEAAEWRFEVFANLDLGRAIGWDGATLHANAYWITGSGLTSTRVGNLLTVSSIEADTSLRLFSLWIEQSFFANAVSVRAGQIAADDEFFVSPTASLFINSTFGWPGILGINLPSGGPAYPLATPGIRIKTALSPNIALSAALFNGNPAPAGTGDPQRRDANGTSFRADGGYFAIAEAAYSFNINLFGNALPGTAKLGGWFNSNDFADERFDADGVSLADPASSHIPALHTGNFGSYVIVDQLLARTTGTSDQGWNVFFRIGEAPGDRNLISLHADAGTSYAGLIPGRENDVIGLAVSFEQISDARRRLADDARYFSGADIPTPDFESAVELTYQTQIAPWLIAQPDFQWIIHPGARLSSSANSTKTATPNALVGGIRLAVSL